MDCNRTSWGEYFILTVFENYYQENRAEIALLTRQATDIRTNPTFWTLYLLFLDYFLQEDNSYQHLEQAIFTDIKPAKDGTVDVQRIYLLGNITNLIADQPERANAFITLLRNEYFRAPNQKTAEAFGLSMGMKTQYHQNEAGRFFLNEIRELQQAFPKNLLIAQILGGSIFNFYNNTGVMHPGLEEIRQLYNQFPADEQFITYLFSAIHVQITLSNNTEIVPLVNEQRALYNKTTDSAVALTFAKSLGTASLEALKKAAYDPYLDELTGLQSAHNGAEPIAYQLAVALYAAMAFAAADDQRFLLFGKLQTLYREFESPDMARVYAAGLVAYTRSGTSLKDWPSCINELWLLADKHPLQTEIPEAISESVHAYAMFSKDHDLASEQSANLYELYRSFPGNKKITASWIGTTTLANRLKPLSEKNLLYENEIAAAFEQFANEKDIMLLSTSWYYNHIMRAANSAELSVYLNKVGSIRENYGEHIWIDDVESIALEALIRFSNELSEKFSYVQKLLALYAKGKDALIAERTASALQKMLELRSPDALRSSLFHQLEQIYFENRDNANITEHYCRGLYNSTLYF